MKPIRLLPNHVLFTFTVARRSAIRFLGGLTRPHRDSVLVNRFVH